MIPDFIDDETLELIDELLLQLNGNLTNVLNKIMPHRTNSQEWTLLLGIGLFVHNYCAGRTNFELTIDESLGHGFSILLQNREIQNHISKILASSGHSFMMGGSQ